MLKIIRNFVIIALVFIIAACDSKESDSGQANKAPESTQTSAPPAAETNAGAPAAYLTNEEIMAQIIGNSAEGKTESGDDYIEYYDPSGKIVGLSKKDGPYEASWRLRHDNLMCFKYGDGPMDGGCVRISLKDGKIGFTLMDGHEEPSATLIKGKSPQLN